jgi:hypothetical protein
MMIGWVGEEEIKWERLSLRKAAGAPRRSRGARTLLDASASVPQGFPGLGKTTAFLQLIRKFTKTCTGNRGLSIHGDLLATYTIMINRSGTTAALCKRRIQLTQMPRRHGTLGNQSGSFRDDGVKAIPSSRPLAS